MSQQFDDLIPTTAQITRWLLRFLTVVILIGLFGGTIKTLLDLQLLFITNVENALRQALINIVTLLAVVEILKTARSYVSEGRVRVIYIIDTVLIVMLNEVMSFWFKEGGRAVSSIIILLAVILTLVFARAFATRYHSFRDDEE